MEKEIFDEVRANYTDGNFICIDAWKIGKEEGSVIAVVNVKTADVYWIDKFAMNYSPMANNVVNEVVKKIKDDIWLLLVAVDEDDDYVVPCFAVKSSEIVSGNVVEYAKENLFRDLGYIKKEEMDEDVLVAYNTLCDNIGSSTGAIENFEGYTLYWKEIAVI